MITFRTQSVNEYEQNGIPADIIEIQNKTQKIERQYFNLFAKQRAISLYQWQGKTSV